MNFLRSCGGCFAHLVTNDSSTQTVYCKRCKPKYVKPFDEWAAAASVVRLVECGDCHNWVPLVDNHPFMVSHESGPGWRCAAGGTSRWDGGPLRIGAVVAGSGPARCDEGEWADPLLMQGDGPVTAETERQWVLPADAKVDVVFADGAHRYWSTHCRHDRHDACKATELAPGVPRQPSQCKTCAAPCLCPCHNKPATSKENPS